MSGKKINILFFIDYLYGGSGGGTEKHLSYLTTLLSKEKFRCFVVAFDCAETTFVKGLREKGVELFHIPVGRYYTVKAARKAKVLFDFIKRLHIDIVQTFHFKSDTYGALVARLSGVKHIVSSKRDVADQKTKWHFFLNKRFAWLFSGVIVVADKVGEVVVQKENIPSSKIVKIYNGVDITKFRPPNAEEKSEARRHIGLTDDDFVVGMVAVFRPEKNHGIFFQGLKEVSRKIDNLKVIAVGAGPELTNCMKYCEEVSLTDRVIFTGATDRVEKYLKTYDVACLIPGSNEGFSNSILEKMAMGLPLIVSDVGGNAEAVIDGYNGFVIPPNNSMAFANSIVDLHSNNEKRNLMGVRSRMRAEEHFSLEKMIKKHEKYYKNICGNNLK